MQRHNIQTLFLLIILIIASSYEAQAASNTVCDERKHEALSAALNKHNLDVGHMMRTRSMSGPSPKMRVKGFSRKVSEYLKYRPNSAFIFFASDENYLCSFMWVFGDLDKNDNFHYHRIQISHKKIDHLSEQLRSIIHGNLSAYNRMPKKKRGFQVFSGPENTKSVVAEKQPTPRKELSSLIFPAEYRPHLKKIKHLSILPIRSMSSVPVGMLHPLGDERTSIDLFSINFLTVAVELEKRGRVIFQNRGHLYYTPKFQSPLIIGNPTATNDPEWLFPELPGAENEAKVVSKIWGGHPILRKHATIKAFQERSETADLIYVAAHGISDPNNPLDKGFIAMSDNRLTSRMVQGMQLKNHPLVVLSACQSGTGKTLEAGIIGLARAFQIAGAANTVMSLWSIDDEATSYMMTHFARGLKKHPPSEALRLAMIQARTKYPEPKYWASFNVFGMQTAIRK